MASRRKRAQLPASIPDSVRRLYQQLPVYGGHDREGYERLLAEFTATVDPQDAIEAIWVKDVVDHIWEAQQLRRIRAKLLEPEDRAQQGRGDQARLDGGQGPPGWDLLRIYHQNPEVYKLSPEERRVFDREAEKEAERRVAERQRQEREAEKLRLNDPDEVSARLAAAYLKNSAELERLSRLIALSNSRRDATLREIERRRAQLGARLRQASEDIVDAEFTESETAPTGRLTK